MATLEGLSLFQRYLQENERLLGQQLSQRVFFPFRQIHTDKELTESLAQGAYFFKSQIPVWNTIEQNRYLSQTLSQLFPNGKICYAIGGYGQSVRPGRVVEQIEVRSNTIINAQRQMSSSHPELLTGLGISTKRVRKRSQNSTIWKEITSIILCCGETMAREVLRSLRMQSDKDNLEDFLETYRYMPTIELNDRRYAIKGVSSRNSFTNRNLLSFIEYTDGPIVEGLSPSEFEVAIRIPYKSPDSAVTISELTQSITGTDTREDNKLMARWMFGVRSKFKGKGLRVKTVLMDDNRSTFYISEEDDPDEDLRVSYMVDGELTIRGQCARLLKILDGYTEGLIDAKDLAEKLIGSGNHRAVVSLGACLSKTRKLLEGRRIQIGSILPTAQEMAKGQSAKYHLKKD